jgi:hypothetical protein
MNTRDLPNDKEFSWIFRVKKAMKGNLEYERIFIGFFKRVEVPGKTIKRMVKKAEKEERIRAKMPKTCSVECEV